MPIEIPADMPKPTTPMTAAHARCIYCAGSAYSAMDCESIECALWSLRAEKRADKQGAEIEIIKVGRVKRRDDTQASLFDEKDKQKRIRVIKPNYLSAIRNHCLWCCGDNRSEVSLCTEPDCPLFSFKTGHKPKIEASPAQIEARRKAGERMKKIQAGRR
jgi:hypothetical protein